MKNHGRFLNSRDWIFLGLSGLLFSSLAQADFIVHRWENQQEPFTYFRSKLEGNYFGSTSNFDASGNSAASPAYSRIVGDLTLATGLFESVTLYGRLSWLSNTQNSATRPGSVFGLGDQTVGLNFRVLNFEHGLTLHRKIIHIDLQFQSDFAAYNNATSDANNPRTPYLGDGSVDWTAGVFMTAPFHAEKEDGYELRFGAGYTARNLGFSSALPFNISLSYSDADEGFTGALGGAGFLSLKNDTHTPQVRSSEGSGDSFITGGTNASWLQLYAKVGYQFVPGTELVLNASYALWGQLAPSGFMIGLGFQKRFGSGTSKPIPALQNEAEYGKGNRGFVNYSLDAKVVKSHDRLNLLKLDKGDQEGVEVGQIFDIFMVRQDGSIGGAVARAEVTSVKLEEAALEITEYYKDVPIDEGFIAKRLVQ